MSLNPAVADFIAEDKFWGLECKYYFACKRVFVDGVDTGEEIKPLHWGCRGRRFKSCRPDKVGTVDVANNIHPP